MHTVTRIEFDNCGFIAKLLTKIPLFFRNSNNTFASWTLINRKFAWDGNTLRLGIAVVFLAGLYIKEFKPKNNFLTALKDSYPYFLALYLVSLGTWVPMLFGALLMFWDFYGDGWGESNTWFFKKR